MINKKTAALFDGWNETMILSCLQGHMGHLTVDNPENPCSARITVGDFCFLAGIPCEKLISEADAPIITPQSEAWCEVIEKVYNNKVRKSSRYSIKKEPAIFDRNKLNGFVLNLPDGFTLQRIDESVYDVIIRENWCADFCSLFSSMQDYFNRGIGFVVIENGIPVSGASSYTIYDGGIEIEIDTKLEYRKMGLATACGARLILECLDRGQYPSWDAHDLRSVALAEKLCYHMDKEYVVYIKN